MLFGLATIVLPYRDCTGLQVLHQVFLMHKALIGLLSQACLTGFRPSTLPRQGKQIPEAILVPDHSDAIQSVLHALALLQSPKNPVQTPASTQQTQPDSLPVQQPSTSDPATTQKANEAVQGSDDARDLSNAVVETDATAAPAAEIPSRSSAALSEVPEIPLAGPESGRLPADQT